MTSSLLGLACMLIGSLVLIQAESPEMGQKEIFSKEEALRLLSQLAESRRGLNYLRSLINEAEVNLMNSNAARDDAYPQLHGLKVLSAILDDLEAEVITKQKRTCKVNLGGHCATENAVAMADQWHFLNSPNSPGRRRRHVDSLAINRLIRR